MSELLPFLLREKTRHGALVYYVRIGSGRRHRVRGEIGSQDFLENYARARAIAELEAAGPSKAQDTSPTPLRWRPGSFGHAINIYLASTSFTALGKVSAKRDANKLIQLAEGYGRLSPNELTAQIWQTLIDQMPAPAARGVKKPLKRFYNWAIRQQLATTNPVPMLDVPRLPNNGGFKPWTREEVAIWRAHWPIDTVPRLALELLLNSLARRADVATMSWAHIQNGKIVFRPAKTSKVADVLVSLPVLPPLQQCLDAHISKRGNCLTILKNGHGKPFASASGFSNVWQDWGRACSCQIGLHGVRKLGAEILAENGATEDEIAAALGHTNTAQARTYTRKVRRDRLGERAGKLLQIELAKGAGLDS